jgi:hypothetical protein
MNRRQGARTLLAVKRSCHVAWPLDKKEKGVLLSIQGIVSLEELLRSRSRYHGRQGPMELGGVTGLVK